LLLLSGLLTCAVQKKNAAITFIAVELVFRLVIFDVQEKYSKTSKKMAREKGIRAPASRDPSASEQRSERQRAEIRDPSASEQKTERQRAEIQSILLLLSGLLTCAVRKFFRHISI